MHIDVWIDVDAVVDQHTVETANKFQKEWKDGSFTVHIRKESAGLTSQWLDAWTLSILQHSAENVSDMPDELALIVEDGVEVSPYYSLWLRRCHSAYDSRPDFAACTLQRASLCAAENCHRDLKGGPKSATVNFFYPLLGTWGFSPSRQHWNRFTQWAHNFIKSGAKP